MAYLNEFPHFEADKLNLDWILEQYSTFNKRLEEIMTAFQTAVDEMQADVDEIRSYTQEQLRQIRADFAEFQSQINEQFADLTEDFESQFAQFEQNFADAFTRLTNQINQNVDDAIDRVEATVDEINDNTIAWLTENLPDLITDVGYLEQRVLTTDWTIVPTDQTKVYKEITLDVVNYFNTPRPLFIKVGNDLGEALIKVTESGTSDATVVYQRGDLNIQNARYEIGMTSGNPYYRVIYDMVLPLSYTRTDFNNSNIISNTVVIL